MTPQTAGKTIVGLILTVFPPTCFAWGGGIYSNIAATAESTAWILSKRAYCDVAQVSIRHLARTTQEKYEKCWHKSQLLVPTQCLNLQHPPTVQQRGYFHLVCCGTLLKTVTHFYLCWGALYMSRKWQVLWIPPTEIHAIEAESEDGA